MIPLLSAQQFKTLHRSRIKSTVFGVRKQSVEKVEKLGDNKLQFTISTGAVDRDLDCINPKGWALDNYSKNPVVLWSHRAEDLPIGKAIDFGADDNRLFSAVEFLPDGYGKASELADMVYRMARDGFISATSVGFRPLAWDFTQDKDRGADDWMPGIDFHEQELVEFSLVTVPSNPEALIEPGEFSNRSSEAIIPAPVQVLSAEVEREKRARRRRLFEALSALGSVG